MKFFKDNKQEIAANFKSVTSLKELVRLLNKIQTWEYDNPYWKKTPKPISEKALRYFLYKKKNKYRSFEIPKKSGGTRSIKAPHRYLKMIQRYLNLCFLSVFTPAPNVTGFVPGKNVVTNAAMHTGKKYVYNIDLKDFFPSISFFRVWAVLSKVPPFRLDNEVARIIANLCCDDECLPQGAPTSPILSNAVCMRLDRKLYNLAKEMDFTYSRYADDITISSNTNIFSPEFREKIFTFIKEEGFEVNLKKERLQKNNVVVGGELIRERQEVTGIIVNRKTNVSRSYIKNLRAALHNWELKGYDQAVAKYEYYYQREKGFIRYKGETPPFENYIAGKLEYLGMVRGKEDSTYRLLKIQFDSLCMKAEVEADELLEILEIWEEKGIKKAMDKFYNRQNLLAENG